MTAKQKQMQRMTKPTRYVAAAALPQPLKKKKR